MFRSLIFILLGVVWTLTAHAGIQFSPIQMYLKDPTRQKSTTVVVESTGLSTSKLFEVLAFKWSQDNKGEDILIEDESILFNPKIFELKPESKQLVRVGFTQPPVLATEGTWRVIFKEVTPVAENTAINFLFNFSLPLFVGPQADPKLSVNLKKADVSQIIYVENKGSSHVKLTELQVIDAKGITMTKMALSQYVLGGNTIEIPLEGFKTNGEIKIKIKTEDDEKYLEFMIKG
ncbi:MULTISPECIES: molecular chaperone [Acinetobacter]|jgi:fimbrial chaperone protein|uniref:fimbrial biogenesis chaperone n=2 Tax=Moraxellaceae TaxID=468 RepID=UPI0001BB9A90|nr:MULTISPECIES: fimbria/pilus periplasmic chaperone [Acinetobacter]EEY91084.1 hypothetical protein HMPREF0017_00097 [Acinetobacter lwoffii SH145]MCU4366472.1 fimbria/pilus periplasmic chaperone [Acinetobacter variabilis]QKW81519.1 molecular chaperone [Acinetobacter sp. FDAARGOS_724]QZD33057.1 hypothetical protein ABEKA_1029 [Acinetobacter lwoffii]UXI51564.1 fimbria/pilus periplasmic chaperone [Acinetobacter variabilis]